MQGTCHVIPYHYISKSLYYNVLILLLTNMLVGGWGLSEVL